MPSLPHTVQIKRVYEPAAPNDGKRIPVDRVWPRGVTKERAALDLLPVTLLYSAHDAEHNQAVALVGYLAL